MRILALLFLLLVSPALAQTGAAVKQSGNVTPGHAAYWVAPGVIADAGTATQGYLSSIGVTASGPSICANSGAVTGAYNQICLGATQFGGGQITLNNVNGATGGVNIVYNGVSQAITSVTLPVTVNDSACFATTGGNLKDCGGTIVSGPGSTVVGNPAIWNNTTGSLLAQATLSGNTSVFGTVSGVLVNGDCLIADSGNIVDSGTPGCGSGNLVASGVPSAGQIGIFASANSIGGVTALLTTILKEISTGSYSIPSSVQGDILSNQEQVTNPVTITLPQATTSFGAGWSFLYLNSSTANFINTLTPTTSTINGLSSYNLAVGDWCMPASDGTNYEGPCAPGSLTGQLTSGPISSGQALWFGTTDQGSTDYFAAYNSTASLGINSGLAAALALQVASNNIELLSSNRAALYNGIRLSFLNSSQVEDTAISRNGAATLMLGGLPISGFANTAATGPNIVASLSTGTATNPDMVFQTGVKTSSGSTQATATTALTLKGETQQAIFAAAPVETAVSLTGCNGSTATMNLAKGSYFYCTISAGTTTLAVSNPAASGLVSSFTLELTNGGSQTINWMTGTKWPGGSAPTLTTSGVDILVCSTRDAATTWRCVASEINSE